MQTSQGYIFRILQHFATKFYNFTNFNKFFTGIYFFLPRSKMSLTCKLSIARTTVSSKHELAGTFHTIISPSIDTFIFDHYTVPKLLGLLPPPN
jgi:hypothetical protein